MRQLPFDPNDFYTGLFVFKKTTRLEKFDLSPEQKKQLRFYYSSLSGVNNEIRPFFKVVVSLINAMVTHKRTSGVFTKRSLRELVKCDSNWKKVGFSNDKYKMLIAYLQKTGIFELVTPSNGERKPSIVTLVEPRLIETFFSDIDRHKLRTDAIEWVNKKPKQESDQITDLEVRGQNKEERNQKKDVIFKISKVDEILEKIAWKEIYSKEKIYHYTYFYKGDCEALKPDKYFSLQNFPSSMELVVLDEIKEKFIPRLIEFYFSILDYKKGTPKSDIVKNLYHELGPLSYFDLSEPASIILHERFDKNYFKIVNEYLSLIENEQEKFRKAREGSTLFIENRKCIEEIIDLFEIAREKDHLKYQFLKEKYLDLVFKGKMQKNVLAFIKFFEDIYKEDLLKDTDEVSAFFADDNKRTCIIHLSSLFSQLALNSPYEKAARKKQANDAGKKGNDFNSDAFFEYLDDDLKRKYVKIGKDRYFSVEKILKHYPEYKNLVAPEQENDYLDKLGPLANGNKPGQSRYCDPKIRAFLYPNDKK